MSGGGRNDYFGGTRPINELRDDALRHARDAEAEAAINAYLGTLLAAINDRDADKVRAYLEDIETIVSAGVLEVTTLLFGGSVAKRTYVEGLSDVDVLLGFSPDVVGVLSPAELRDMVRQALTAGLPTREVAGVSAGTLAVTVNYRDGTQIQVLPALRSQEDLQIGSPAGTEWAAIHPERFARKLTAVNEVNGGRVVPLIKLAKQLVSGYAEGRTLSGYHVESLAIKSFDGYDGPRSLTSMLTHFFSSAARAVLAPIRDRSGQSVHVDDYLGESGSLARRLRADSLARTARRLETAQTPEQWQAILEAR